MMKLLRHRLRGVAALTAVLALAALFFSLPLTPSNPRLQLPISPAPAPAPAYEPTALMVKLDDIKSPPTTPPNAKKSPLEELLEESERNVKSEGDMTSDLTAYVQDYTPEDWVEVQKINAKPGSKGKGRNNKPKPPISISNDKYSPQVLKERALTFSNTSGLWEFLREQQRRVDHIIASCLKLPANSADLRAGPGSPPVTLLTAKDFIFDRKNHLTFCPVYKAASTSWTITLLQLNGVWNEKMKKGNLQKIVRQYFPKINGLSVNSRTSDTIRFMVARHPFERLVSCYRDKFEHASKAYYYLRYGEKMVHHYRKFSPIYNSPQLQLLKSQVRNKIKAGRLVVMPENPYANPVGPTFPEFVGYVIDAKFDDEHWKPIHNQCAVCSMTYDFILRFESLSVEGKWMLEYLNRSGEVGPRWDNPTIGNRTSEVTCSYFSQLTLSQINNLYAKYYKDFKLYEYSSETYRECAKDYHLLKSKNKTIPVHETMKQPAKNPV